MPDPDNPCSPYGLILQTAQAVDNEVIVTTDVGEHQMWVAQAYPINRPRQLLTSAGLGTMGFGLLAAIGATLAHPLDERGRDEDEGVQFRIRFQSTAKRVLN